jgi:hypothetical protein
VASQGVIAVSGSVISDLNTQWGEIAEGKRQEMNYSRTAAAGFVSLGAQAISMKSEQLQTREAFFTKRLESGVPGPASEFIYKTLKDRQSLAAELWKGAKEITEMDQVQSAMTEKVDSLTRSDQEQKGPETNQKTQP